MYKNTLFFLLSLLVFACQKQNITQTKSPILKDTIQILDTNKITKSLDSISIANAPTTTIDNAFENANIEEIDFQFLKAKAKVSYKSNTIDENFTVDFRIKKDSIIWMNISKFGISGATALLSNTEVKLYNSFQKTYNEMSYESLSELFNFKITYDILQSLIVGNRPFKKNKSRVTRENEYYLIKQEDKQVHIDNYIGDDKKLKKILLTQDETDNKLTLDFADFSALNQYLFPNSSLITIDYTDKKDNKKYKNVINIKHSKVELTDTPLQFPFKVPAELLKK
ncbi:MAG: DUF4292 domain-containing protein [Pseudarcicella sp.]|nr:DUF4292 domain-containing protein [Pseudarcicella sp.]MBP6409933.1 DUF4292 domain-containing protein [Pseudarcicella sp.]